MRSILASPSKALFGLGLFSIIIIVAISVFGIWGDMIASVYTQQQALHQKLISALRALREAESWLSAGPLITISFLYGLFHAAGPGHGKVIISTYLLANRDDVKKGITLAVLAAIMQGIVAISLIYGLVYIADLVPRDTKSAVNWSERLGFALVVVLGLMLIRRAIRSFRSNKIQIAHNHDHGHHHHDSHDHKHAHHDHKHDHEHGEDCGCGHAHAPSLDEVRSASDWRTSLAIIFSIGLRPCTGAILVLVFAIVTKQFWAGIFSVFAMSLGTALAISILALITISMRDTATRIFAGNNGRSLTLLTTAITLIGGVALVLIGASLFQASFQMRGSFGL